MGHDSAVKNPSQIWGGDNSVFNQMGEFVMSPFQKQNVNLQAPPPPPNPSGAAAASLNTEVKQEQANYSASSLLTGGQGVSGQPTTASAVLTGK